ncbi:MAG: NusG domain II-containing protein, partial [Clostridia bacterium]|nr:NusG domain II-containing protein [Clostridia bacterium]
MKRKLINGKEIAVIVLVFVASLGVFFYYKNAPVKKIAKITVNGEVFKEINLSENTETYVLDIQSEGKTAHILVDKSKIGFINHECPDGICETAGMLSTHLQTAVCLPLRVS